MSRDDLVKWVQGQVDLIQDCWNDEGFDPRDPECDSPEDDEMALEARGRQEVLRALAAEAGIEKLIRWNPLIPRSDTYVR